MAIHQMTHPLYPLVDCFTWPASFSPCDQIFHQPHLYQNGPFVPFYPQEAIHPANLNQQEASPVKTLQFVQRIPPFIDDQYSDHINFSRNNPDGPFLQPAKNLMFPDQFLNVFKQLQDRGMISQLIFRDAKPFYAAEETSPIQTSGSLFEPGSIVHDEGDVFGGEKIKLSILEQRESLPIFKFKDEFLQRVSENQILIVTGETGSGKTTQLTQYLAEAGYGSPVDKIPGRRMIGCTQPRRLAAISMANRVAEELGAPSKVGYRVRFDNRVGDKAIIKYMTEGILINEYCSDRSLNAYSVIILDEAHERSVTMDILFGLLKKVVLSRKNFRLIITSATLDTAAFVSYFSTSKPVPVLDVPGKLFPVEVIYKDSEHPYLVAAMCTVLEILLNTPTGDILLFLTGEKEIDAFCDVLEDLKENFLAQVAPRLQVMPVYGALAPELQSQIFNPTLEGERKVVVATNIAEASLTVDGISYVVDPGFVKQNVFNASTCTEQLLVTFISQAQAKQRAGRAGRTGPGTCYRLYSQATFEAMPPNPVPEIKRTSLTQTILTLKSIGIEDPVSFQYMDPPPMHSIVSALSQLHSLGALNDGGFLTRDGKRMAKFSLDPMLSRIILTSVHLGCSEEILTIVASLGPQHFFYLPKNKDLRIIARDTMKGLSQPEGDLITFLEVHNRYFESRRPDLLGCYKHDSPARQPVSTRAWCKDNFVNFRSFDSAKRLREQLAITMKVEGLKVTSCQGDLTKVQKAICSGFFENAAIKVPNEKGKYLRLVDKQIIFLPRWSPLYECQPDWVVYHRLVHTSRSFMREVTVIEPEWLVEMSRHSFGWVKS